MLPSEINLPRSCCAPARLWHLAIRREATGVTCQVLSLATESHQNNRLGTLARLAYSGLRSHHNRSNRPPRGGTHVSAHGHPTPAEIRSRLNHPVIDGDG